MSSFWSIWISVITLGTILGCFLILRWCLKNKTGVKEGDDMHHEFDGIVEINNPLPRWWTIMFYATIVWGLIYLALYPGLGNFAGLLGWQSSIQDARSVEEVQQKRQAAMEEGGLLQYAREMEQAEERFGPIFEAYAKRDVKDLATDPEALKVGQRLFIQNCSQCHGSDARGMRGFPNLTDDDWLYGGSPSAIKTTLLQGRQGQMPAWKDAFGEQGVKEVVAYTLSLSGRKVDPKLAEAGESRFAACAACHGQDGKGKYAFGAPNLTDNTWLYGGSEKAVTETLMYGRNGVMPAWKDILGEDKVHVLTAYVYSLSQDTSEQAQQ
ncbi:Cbb3-type cytochrome c oxidase subunit CcoP1 [Saliniradius amylolyticus]|uniref:Cbb3-type cytochrome c oxidase subunit n=1 Tax=Saliniradius amylolyticus TaxID=2183582 RepID=A0A2S2E2T9_9ALTE|nr:cytochrome-c oxidase, cbb3-type subunit III [Saliniradius amylolyticus]AWL11953.1 Cbb3-type cytochrome c oxidase subunit CcoP1 [Saliniradius amylolyticus]